MPTATESQFLERAKQMATQIISWRRHIHEHPELGFEERGTAAYVAEQLKTMGIDAKTGVGGTGVIADIGTDAKAPLVALRADMDALPITEANTVSYCSTNKGVMHACGHDAHTACLLGAAKLLSECAKDNALPGRVRLLFQPAEETVNKENKSGATLMLEDGALKGVSALAGLHVFPFIETGSIAIRTGPVLAACDSFDVVIKGKGCHGAQPEVGIDAVVLAAQAVQSLQTVVSRRLAANEVGLLTIGGIKSSSYAPNVVAAAVEMTGTVRYMEEHLHEHFLAEVKRALSVVEALGGSYELDYRQETPVLRNDRSVTETVTAALAKTLGPENVVEFKQMLGAEDFAFYTAHVPSCFFALGASIADNPRDFHSPTFDINEEALPIGSASLAQAAVALLQAHA